MVDPRTAIRRALAAYLKAELATSYPAMKVFDEWPHGEPLGQLALSVTIPPGEVEALEFPPVPIRFTPAGASGVLLYSRGRVTVGVQIDLWCGFPAVRDEVAPAVNALLNQPPSATVGPTRLGSLAQAPGLVLSLTELYSGLASLNFPPLPMIDESSDVQQEARFRAIWQGTADVHLLVEESVATMQHLTLKLSVNGGASTDVALF